MDAYRAVAEVVGCPGVEWVGCPGCVNGSIRFMRSADWDCEDCGATHLFGAHDCPKNHNHPIANDFTGHFDLADFTI